MEASSREKGFENRTGAAQMLVGLISSGGAEKESVPFPSPGLSWMPAVLGVLIL